MTAAGGCSAAILYVQNLLDAAACVEVGVGTGVGTREGCGDNNQNDGGGTGNGQEPTPAPEADPVPERPNTAQWAKEWLRWQAAKDSLSTAERDAAEARWNQVQCNYHSRRGRTRYCR